MAITFTRIDSEGNWVPIYIGQGELSIRAHEDHQQIASINSKGATYIHLHLNAEEGDRLAEQEDLLANHAQAYSPRGCNARTRP